MDVGDVRCEACGCVGVGEEADVGEGVAEGFEDVQSWGGDWGLGGMGWSICAPSGRKMMVLALELLGGLAMYVGRPAISLSVPAGVPVARVPERQQGFIVGSSAMVVS